MARILVVDDEAQMCQVVEGAFGATGYAVKSCFNGTDAIERYRREGADLVFCDLKLPGVDGLVVLEAIKTIDPWTTVIMVTAYGTVDTATRALRMGAYDFIEKPCTMAQLQEVAKRALEHRKQVKQLAALQGKPGSPADIPARLMELEQLKADFLTLVAQELRVPMRHMSETMALVEQGFYGAWDEAKKKQFLGEISKAESAFSRLFLASFSLFLSHEQRVTITLGDVAPLVDEILQEAEMRCQERQIGLKTFLPQGPLKGRMDMEKVAYILRELLDNAARFTPAGGSITVDCASAPEGFRMEVSDTGCGILPEEQESLFTAFRQSPADQRLRKQKSGLGLPLVRHYADLLNGSITVESQPGKGSRFTVTLPWWRERK